MRIASAMRWLDTTSLDQSHICSLWPRCPVILCCHRDTECTRCRTLNGFASHWPILWHNRRWVNWIYIYIYIYLKNEYLFNLIPNQPSENIHTRTGWDEERRNHDRFLDQGCTLLLRDIGSDEMLSLTSACRRIRCWILLERVHHARIPQRGIGPLVLCVVARNRNK